MLVSFASCQDRPEAPRVLDAREVVEQHVRRLIGSHRQHIRQLVELGVAIDASATGAGAPAYFEDFRRLP